MVAAFLNNDLIATGQLDVQLADLINAAPRSIYILQGNVKLPDRMIKPCKKPATLRDKRFLNVAGTVTFLVSSVASIKPS
jgi:hypothetical protein